MKTAENGRSIAPSDRGAVLTVKWAAVLLLMLAGGEIAEGIGFGIGVFSVSDAEWIGRATGLALGFAVIPSYVAAWTHMKRPGLVLLVWTPIALVFLCGATVLRHGGVFGVRLPAPASAAAAPTDWSVTEAAFENAHPDLKYGANYKIMQEHVNALGRSGLGDKAMLETAYAATLQDSRWQNGP